MANRCGLSRTNFYSHFDNKTNYWRKQISRHFHNGELVSVDTLTVYQPYGVVMLDPVMEYEGGYGNYVAFDLDTPHGSQLEKPEALTICRRDEIN